MGNIPLFGTITGDPDADRYIKEKVAEDYRKPETSFTKSLKEEQGEPILGFKGSYRWLSNFSPSAVTTMGRTFPTVEHAYQAAKRPEDFELHEKLLYMSPGEAKNVMSHIPITCPDWELVKIQAMKMLVEQKFFRHEHLMWMLLGTRQKHIEEVNDWGDDFWGTRVEDKLHPVVSDIMGVVYNGKNELGKILMEVRHLLRLSIAGGNRVITREDIAAQRESPPDDFYYKS